MRLAVRIASVILAVGLCFGAEQFFLGLHQDYLFRLVVLAGLYVTLSVSLNLINGITGQFSIGHAAFYQVGAYTAGFTSVKVASMANLPPLAWLVVSCLIGAAGAAVAGFVVGLPSLRLKGDYLAIVTLGFGEIIRIVTQNIEAIGGSYGMNVTPKIPSLWMVWLLAVVCVAVCRNLLKTAHGLPFLAVREDEVAGAAMGVDVTKIKVTAFVLGSAFAGAAGAMLAHFEGFITPDQFKMDTSFIVLTMVVLGGTGSITGSVLAAIALFGIPEWLRSLKGADGGPLLVSGNSVMAWFIAVVVAVAVVRWLQTNFHRPIGQRTMAYCAVIVCAYLLQLGLAPLLGLVPQLASGKYEIGLLRMVIFAMTLIILMLLRPQGILGHHEFAWDVFKKRRRLTEVEA